VYVSNATLEMTMNAAPTLTAPAGVEPTGPGFVPDCEWESKFSSVVDSVCRDYTGELPSFLDLTWD